MNWVKVLALFPDLVKLLSAAILRGDSNSAAEHARRAAMAQAAKLALRARLK